MKKNGAFPLKMVIFHEKNGDFLLKMVIFHEKNGDFPVYITHFPSKCSIQVGPKSLRCWNPHSTAPGHVAPLSSHEPRAVPWSFCRRRGDPGSTTGAWRGFLWHEIHIEIYIIYHIYIN
jgi:hypothetical protein